MKRVWLVCLLACAQSDEDTAPALSGELQERTTEDNRIAIIWRNQVAAGEPEALSVADVSVTAGKVEDTQNGRVVFDPTGAFDQLNEGQEQIATVTLRVKDARGRVSEPYSFTIVVGGVNDAPSSPDLAMTVTEDTVGTLALPATTDVDDAAATLTATFDDGGVGSTTIAAGVITYDPQAAFQALGEGQAGALIIRYAAADAHQAESAMQGEIVVTVSGVNDAPVAVADAFNVADNRPTRLNVLANDSDIDVGDTLTLVSVTGEHVAIDGRDVVITPPAPGVYAFSYTVADLHGAMATAAVTVSAAEGCDVSVEAGATLYVGGMPPLALSWATSGCTSCTLVNTEPPLSGVSGATNVTLTGVPTLLCTDVAGEFATSFGVAYAPAFFVAPSGSGADGLSWETAFTTLDAASDAATAREGADIWVREGNYAIAETIGVTGNVSFYGGFSEALTGQQGELGARTARSVLTSNGQRIMLMTTAEEAHNVLDGFELRDAVLNGGDCSGPALAGVVGDMTFHNVVFAHNSCTDDVVNGGAVKLETFSLAMTDCVFDGNAALASDNAVGGAFNAYAQTTVRIERTLFSDNNATSQNGNAYSGLYLDAPTFDCFDCVFSSNTATADAIAVGGGFFSSDTVDLSGSSFLNNAASGATGAGAFLSTTAPSGAYTATGNIPE